MAKLWIDQMNAKGGLLGKHIKEIEADTKTDKVEGAKAGQAMVDGGAVYPRVTCDYDNGSPAASKARGRQDFGVSMRLRPAGRRRRRRPPVVHRGQRRPDRRRVARGMGDQEKG